MFLLNTSFDYITERRKKILLPSLYSSIPWPSRWEQNKALPKVKGEERQQASENLAILLDLAIYATE